MMRERAVHAHQLFRCAGRSPQQHAIDNAENGLADRDGEAVLAEEADVERDHELGVPRRMGLL